MLEKLLQVRFIYLAAVIITLINSIIFLIVGVIHSIEGYKHFFDFLTDSDTITGPGIYLLEALDSFLVSMVFLVFALGMMKIFIHYHKTNDGLPKWLHIHDFRELKIILWETVLVTLVVFSVTTVAKAHSLLSWQNIILPLIVLILSLSLLLVKKSDSQPSNIHDPATKNDD